MRIFAVLGIACFLLSSCSTVGPNALRSGRLAYNEAISETNDQQMLMVLVHNRYEESHQMLAVASVTANVRVSSSAGIEAGFGDSDNYDGNLVPFRGGFVYEENPTISYTPVSGQAYLGELMSPVPLPIFIEISRSLPLPQHAYVMLLASVNGIRNPAFLYGAQQDDPRFDQVVAIMTELTHSHCLTWSSSRAAADSQMVLRPVTASEAEKANQLLDLLGVPESVAAGGTVVVPTYDEQHGPAAGGIGIATHSIMRVVQILSSAVEVPAEHEASGMATQFPTLGRAGRAITISYSDAEPDSAYVAAEYKNGWFYIDDHDLVSKRYFKLLGSLWSAAMAQSLRDGPSAPVLTVPVSR